MAALVTSSTLLSLRERLDIDGTEYLYIVDPNNPVPLSRSQRVQTSVLLDYLSTPGLSAFEVYQANTNPTATLDEYYEFIRGPRGYDNYELWTQAGNVGSIETYFSSIKGNPGATWFNVTAVPTALIGRLGDWAVLSPSGNVYYYGESGWQLTTLRLNATNGSKILRVTGAPATNVGANGDYALDEVTGFLYGPKTNGTWSSSFIRLKGSAGISLLAGEGSPASGIGNVGDTYFDTLTGAGYGPKTAQGWSVSSFSIKGPEGDLGPQGPEGPQLRLYTGGDFPDNEEGNNGDLAFFTNSNLWFGPKRNEAWGIGIPSFVPSLDAILQKSAVANQSVVFIDGVGTRYKDEEDLFGTTLTGQPNPGTEEVSLVLPTTSGTLITEQAVQQLLNALPKGVTYISTWNPTTNTPTLSDATGTQGHFYAVSVSGTVNLGSGPIVFSLGDAAVHNGTVWERWDLSDAITSVNGQTGAVVLTTDNIAEGLALYFTSQRVLDVTTGLYEPAGAVSALEQTLGTAALEDATAFESAGAASALASTLGTAAFEDVTAFESAGSVSALEQTLGTAALEDATAFEPAGSVGTLSTSVNQSLDLKLDTAEVGTSVAPVVAGKIPATYIPIYPEVLDHAELLTISNPTNYQMVRYLPLKTFLMYDSANQSWRPFYDHTTLLSLTGTLTSPVSTLVGVSGSFVLPGGDLFIPPDLLLLNDTLEICWHLRDTTGAYNPRGWISNETGNLENAFFIRSNQGGTGAGSQKHLSNVYCTAEANTNRIAGSSSLAENAGAFATETEFSILYNWRTRGMKIQLGALAVTTDNTISLLACTVFLNKGKT